VQSWCIVKELLAASFFAITFSYSLSVLASFSSGIGLPPFDSKS
jgi:hypothetical protein